MSWVQTGPWAHVEGRTWSWSPGKEVGGAQIKNPLWFSVTSPLVPTWEGLGCKSHIREECEETQVHFICPHDVSPPSSLCLLRGGLPISLSAVGKLIVAQPVLDSPDTRATCLK